ncbi:MAG: Signal peptidase I [Candidatus Moranbacteria bacterium GW2011_GWA2_39_41]|nr:MAG: Signal peptidase I [Candidatus Moranbacteria bacterium GW2011_GWA2_39_41]
MQNNSSSSQIQDERYYGVGGFVLEVIKIFILAFVIIIPIRVFLFQPFFVQGASMEPNFENNQYLIVNEFGYKKTVVGLGGKDFFTIEPFKKLGRQEVIVFRYPKNPTQFFIKRTIGLPGEKIEIKDGKVMIFNDEHPDGFILDESAYIPSNIRTTGDLVIKLKSDEYFVMGDNRAFSSDSRSWGPLSEANIIGKALFRAWPLDKILVF